MDKGKCCDKNKDFSSQQSVAHEKNIRADFGSSTNSGPLQDSSHEFSYNLDKQNEMDLKVGEKLEKGKEIPPKEVEASKRI
jgi:hypothetical protein